MSAYSEYVKEVHPFPALSYVEWTANQRPAEPTLEEVIQRLKDKIGATRCKTHAKAYGLTLRNIGACMDSIREEKAAQAAQAKQSIGKPSETNS